MGMGYVPIDYAARIKGDALWKVLVLVATVFYVEC